MVTSKLKNSFFTIENFSFYLLILFTFLLPLLFSPTPSINFFFLKVIPLFVVTIVCLFLWIFKIFQEGRYKFSFHPFFLVSLFIPIWYLFSSFFATNLQTSLFGTGIETDTVSFIALLFIFAFLVVYFLRSKEKIFLTYLAFGASFIVLSVFQIARLFFGLNFLSFNIFLTTTANTVGKWNEMSIISGIALLLSLLSIEFLRPTKGFKIFSYVILALSIFLVAVTNFAVFSIGSFNITSFTIIGIFALVFFVYFLSSFYDELRNEPPTEKLPAKKRIPIPSLIVLIISIVFTFGYVQIGSYIQNHFQISSYEQRPGWIWTENVAISTITQKPFTGYGPNNFQEGWTLNKPNNVNNTNSWNADYIAGVGNIPTTIVTTGPIGFIAWLSFLILFLMVGFKSLFFKYKDKFSHYLTVSSFLISLFLWLFSFIYVLTTVMIILTFLFTGLFFGSVIREGIIAERVFNFEQNRQKTFTSILFLVVILVGSLFWLYNFGKVFASTIYASKGSLLAASASDENGLLQAQDEYIKALKLVPSDIYLRAVTSINLSRAQLLLTNTTLSQDQLRTNFVGAYQNAYGAANDAIRYNDKSYQNYILRGGVSESIVGLGVQAVDGSGVGDAYQDAKSNYELAEKLNPLNPGIPLLLARLEATKKNFDVSKQYISQALALKPDFADAYLLLAQIQLGQNDTEGAISTLSAGSIVAPDSNLFFTLGTLQYNQKNYREAVDSLEKAVILNPYFSNARYFLALSYHALGRDSDAVIQLEQIKILNPGNADIDSIISTLQNNGTISSSDFQISSSTPSNDTVQ